MDKRALLEAVADRWKGAKLSFAVVHGLSGYPARVGRDLDVLFAPGQSLHGIDLAHMVLAGRGLLVARPPALWGERLVAASLDPDPDLLEVHAVDGSVGWGPAELATYPEPRSSIGPFPVDPWAAFAKRVVLPILAGDVEKVIRELALQPLTGEERGIATRRLRKLVGSAVADRLIEALDAENWARVRELETVLRRTVARRAWTRHPIVSARRIARGLRRRLLQPFSPSGVVLWVAGADGPAVDALIDALCDGDGLVFTRCVARRWSAVRRPVSGVAQHWIRVATLLARGLAHACSDRLHSSRQRLVIYHGTALDIAVQPERFGLRAGPGADLCWYWLPAPDLLILLDAPTIPTSGEFPPARSTTTLGERYRARLATATCPVVIVGDARPDMPMPELRRLVMRDVVRAFLHRNGAGSAS